MKFSSSLFLRKMLILIVGFNFLSCFFPILLSAENKLSFKVLNSESEIILLKDSYGESRLLLNSEYKIQKTEHERVILIDDILCQFLIKDIREFKEEEEVKAVLKFFLSEVKYASFQLKVKLFPEIKQIKEGKDVFYRCKFSIPKKSFKDSTIDPVEMQILHCRKIANKLLLIISPKMVNDSEDRIEKLQREVLKNVKIIK